MEHFEVPCMLEELVDPKLFSVNIEVSARKPLKHKPRSRYVSCGTRDRASQNAAASLGPYAIERYRRVGGNWRTGRQFTSLLAKMTSAEMPEAGGGNTT